MKFEVGLGLGLVLLLLAAVAGFMGWFPAFVFVSTKYAPGYSEAGFNGIKMGDRAEIVTQVLGQPIWAQTNDSRGMMWWRYSQPKWTLWYQDRMVIFSNDLVIYKLSVLNED